MGVAGGGDKRVHAFPKVIALLEYKLFYYDLEEQ